MTDTPSNYNKKMRLDRAVDQLIGICHGITADGVVNKQEADYLAHWLSNNLEVCDSFPGNVIYQTMAEILQDGRIDPGELDALQSCLVQISRNEFINTGSAEPDSPVIVHDTVDKVIFAGKHFCLTGKFVFGSRSKCQEATIMNGGHCDSDVLQQTDYLVIGTLVSPDWKHETYGRKIEKAMCLRGEGRGRPVIITEEQWVGWL